MSRNDSQRGQAIVDLALAFPIFAFVVVVAMQLALVVTQSYSVRQLTRDTARWVALHPDSTDATVLAEARDSVFALLQGDDVTSVTVTPACASLSGGQCPTGRDPGDLVTVEIVYDLANTLFLPSSFGFGAMTIELPTELPPYEVSVLVE